MNLFYHSLIFITHLIQSYFIELQIFFFWIDVFISLRKYLIIKNQKKELKKQQQQKTDINRSELAKKKMHFFQCFFSFLILVDVEKVSVNVAKSKPKFCKHLPLKKKKFITMNKAKKKNKNWEENAFSTNHNWFIVLTRKKNSFFHNHFH